MIKKLLFVVVALAMVLSLFASVFVAPIVSADDNSSATQDSYWVDYGGNRSDAASPNVSYGVPSTETLSASGVEPLNSDNLALTDQTLSIPASKDTYVGFYRAGGYDTNHGSEDNLVAWICTAPPGGYNYQTDLTTLLEFSLASLPANSVITSAKLELYCHSAGSVYDIPVWVYKQMHTDWEELQATYYTYKTGSSWTTPGGDYVTSDPVGTEAIAHPGQAWMEWDVTDIVSDAEIRNIPVELLVKAIEDPYWWSVDFHSKEYTADPSLHPRLVIEYTAGEPPAPKTPVILVHGWCSDSNSWNNTVTFLEHNGYNSSGDDVNLFTIDLESGGRANGDIKTYAGRLSDKIAEVKSITGAKKVDLVCHSMGGLVSRWYTTRGYNNDVRKLVMIATPNHGTELALLGDVVLGQIGIDIGGTAGFEMIPYGPFLNELNHGHWWKFWGSDSTNTAIHHETITGTEGFTEPWKSFTSSLIVGPDDGVVGTWSVPLDGVNDQEVPYDHSDQCNKYEVFQKVLAILQDDTTYATTAVQRSSTLVQDEQGTSTVQQAPMISGKIFSGEQKSYGIPISATSKSTFTLAWRSGNLDLTLTTPSGTTINSSVVEGNSNITYYHDDNTTVESYTVTNPEPGGWQVNISAVNVSEEGENYIVLTFLETTINLSLNFTKYEYNPGEQINIVAELKNDSTSLTGASVIAAIQRPDETVDSLALYDDGLHNDGEANDGIYANAYANTTTWGMYKITVTANGTVDSQEFALQDVSTIWAEYYPDLTLASSDISFSDDAPVSGENVTISAIISNIGEANAGNATIFFYDGAPADSVLIDEDVIDVNASQTSNASVSWNATGGHHEIHVVISPYNGFLEKDYTNNEASKIIDVAGTPIAVIGGPYVGNEGSSITFNGSSSYDPDGTIVNYAWDLNGDGDFSDAQGAVVQHTWPDDYTGNVSLMVTDNMGATNTATTTVTVNNVPPTVEAGLDQNAECCVTNVSFNGSFTDPGTLDTHTIAWNFGDGNNASGTLTPIHKYCATGNYTVTLTVTDNNGGVGTDTLTVHVVDTIPPQVNIASPVNGQTYINTNGSIAISYTATDLCDPALSIVVKLDGTAITAGSIDPLNSSSGAHTLNVTATDYSGNIGTASATFTVTPQILAWGRTWGFMEWSTNGPSPSDFFGGYSYPLVTANSSIYSWISANDSIYWRHTGYQSLPTPWEQTQLYKVKVSHDRVSLTNLSITWRGHGGNGDLIYHTKLKVWNSQTSSWCTLVDVTSPTSKTFKTYVCNLTTNASNFIEMGTGNVSILITSDDDGRGSPENTEGVFTDYLAVTYKK